MESLKKTFCFSFFDTYKNIIYQPHCWYWCYHGLLVLLIIMTCKLVVWRLRRIVTSIPRASDRVHDVLISKTQHGLYGSLSWINFPIFGYGISPGKQRSPMNEPLRRSVFAGTVCSPPQFLPPTKYLKRCSRSFIFNQDSSDRFLVPDPN